MRTSIIFPLLFCASSVFAQKEDYVWLVSHVYGSLDATQLDFNSSPVNIEQVQRDMFFGLTNTSICNSDGNLLLYTNGKKLADSSGNILMNGDSLNYGFWYVNTQNVGYNVPQGAFFLPKPGDNHTIYLFHMYVDFVNGTIPMSPRYSVIDMDANNGQGKVTEKNVELLAADATTNYNQATAVRHANGRDWWVLVSNHMGPQYFRFLLTPNGVEGPWEQTIGFRQETTDWFSNGFGQRLFSLDGSRFADYDFDHFTQVFDFDRCEGLLSNARLVEHTIDPSLNNAGGSVAFSPSGRFLYITTVDNGVSLFQYDIEANDILGSEVIIAHCPLVNQVIECGVASMRLAPDGKIYIHGQDSLFFGAIQQPDSLGLACDFKFDGLKFPLAYPSAHFPYWPNYRLGALEGSGCDTILSDVKTVALGKGAFTLSPNPSAGPSTVSCRIPVGAKGEIIVMDILGRRQGEYPVVQGGGNVTLSSLRTGVYLVVLVVDGEVVQAQKLIFQ